MLPAPDKIQKIAMSLMLVLVAISFTFTNLYALLWTSSEWLISTILPAVIVDLTNAERGVATLPALRHNPVLDAAATLKAEHMATNEYFAHFSPDNVSPWHWFREAGYQYVHAGENLAIHFSDSGEVVEAWMASPTHRENIMNGQFAEIGIGTARGSYQGFPTTYVVQLFGTPLAVPERSFPATAEPSPEPIAVLASDTPMAATDTATSVPTTTTPTLALAEQPIERSSAAKPETAPPAETVVLAERDPDIATSTDADVTTTDSAAVAVTTTPPATDTATTAPVVTMTETEAGDVFFTSSLVTTTTSGTPATIGFVHHNQAPFGWHLLTQPERILQFLYVGIASIVILLLLYAFVREARQHRPYRMAYSIALLLLMGVLWSVHTSLSGGALIV